MYYQTVYFNQQLFYIVGAGKLFRVKGQKIKLNLFKS